MFLSWRKASICGFLCTIELAFQNDKIRVFGFLLTSINYLLLLIGANCLAIIVIWVSRYCIMEMALAASVFVEDCVAAA